MNISCLVSTWFWLLVISARWLPSLWVFKYCASAQWVFILTNKNFSHHISIDIQVQTIYEHMLDIIIIYTLWIHSILNRFYTKWDSIRENLYVLYSQWLVSLYASSSLRLTESKPVTLAMKYVIWHDTLRRIISPGLAHASEEWSCTLAMVWWVLAHVASFSILSHGLYQGFLTFLMLWTCNRVPHVVVPHNHFHWYFIILLVLWLVNIFGSRGLPRGSIRLHSSEMTIQHWRRILRVTLCNQHSDRSSLVMTS